MCAACIDGLTPLFSAQGLFGNQVKGLDGEWQPVPIPSSVKAIVLLNLQSYGGGRDIWGLADNNKDTQRGWKTPIFNDGMFEVLANIKPCISAMQWSANDLECMVQRVCLKPLHPTSANDLMQAILGSALWIISQVQP